MFGAVLNRLATSVRRALSQYAVGANEPELALNFIDNEYITNNSTSTFASAVTHSMSSNSVMTDGYGDELLTNGNFSTGDTTGWTTNGSPTVSRGVVTLPITDSNTRYIQQDLSTVSGVTYVINLNLVDADSNGRVMRVSVDSSAGTFTGDLLAENTSINISGGSVEFVFTATSSTSYFRIFTNSTTNGHYTSLDNISVREMPVLKWAPHNFQEYSDDVSQGTGQTGVDRTATTLTEKTTTGEHRIQVGISPPVVGQKYTMALEAKSGTGSRLLGFRGYGHGGIGNYPVFDIVNGTIETAGANFMDVSITDVGDGYYLCKASVVPASAFRWSVHMIEDGTPPQHSYTGDGSSSILLRKLRQYNSNLGGMTDNPDNSGNDADFVATSGSEKYLPRIGHHVYNGSAWANEGLLAESEARTNYATYYDDFSNAFWTKVTTTVASDDTIAPTGVEAADKITATGDFTRVTFPASGLTDSTDYLVSIYAKEDSSYKFAMNFKNKANVSVSSIFDLRNISASGDGVIQDVGNGWCRCGLKFNLGSGATTPDLRIVTYVSPITAGVNFNNGESIYIYGAQVEAGSTFSSLIPTSGSSVTRAAETFTIPSANLPWPEPVYTGSDVITNGGFDTDSDWTKSTAPASTISGGVATVGGSGGNGYIYQNASLVTGKVYEITFDVTSASATSLTFLRGNSFGNTSGAYIDLGLLTVGTHTAVFVAAYPNIGFTVGGGNTAIVSFDNISVREIDPLSVSIAMDGRMTYADEGDYNTVIFYEWLEDGDNFLRAQVTTNSTFEGRIIVNTEENNNPDQVDSAASDVFAPDVLVPFDIASRHGSTFLNMAQAGISYTENTTPTALADLSSANMTIADTYMGTIGTFRVWDRDITDDGLVEATNPSLEPSLSLTFEGTGTNSFVTQDWSE